MSDLLSCGEVRGGGAPCGAAGLLDAGDLEAGQLLAVTLALAVAGLVLVLEDVDLRALLVPEDLRGDADLPERRGVGGDLVPVDEEQRGQLDGGAGAGREAVDHDD